MEVGPQAWSHTTIGPFESSKLSQNRATHDLLQKTQQTIPAGERATGGRQTG